MVNCPTAKYPRAVNITHVHGKPFAIKFLRQGEALLVAIDHPPLRHIIRVTWPPFQFRYYRRYAEKIWNYCYDNYLATTNIHNQQNEYIDVFDDTIAFCCVGHLTISSSIPDTYVHIHTYIYIPRVHIYDQDWENNSSCPRDWCMSVDQLSALLKHLNTIMLWCTGGLRVASN